MTWDDRRRRLNHDLLRNQAVQALHRCRRVADGSVRNAGHFGADLAWLLKAVDNVLAELDGLLADARHTAAPEAWLARHPLTRLSADDRGWMLDLLRHDWLALVDADVSHARAAAGAVRAAVAGWDRGRAPTADAAGAVRLGQLYSACMDLAAALSALDHADPLKVVASLRYPRP